MARVTARGAERRIAERIAYELRERQKSADWLARTVAEKANVELSRQAIYDILNAERPRRIRVDEYLAIARALDIDPRDLVRPMSDVADEAVGRSAAQVAEAADALDRAFNAYVSAMIDYRERYESVPEGQHAHQRRRVLAILRPSSDGALARPDLVPTFRIDDDRVDTFERDEWQRGGVDDVWSGLAALFEAKAADIGRGSEARADEYGAKIPWPNAERRRLALEGNPGARFQILAGSLRQALQGRTYEDKVYAALAAGRVVEALLPSVGTSKAVRSSRVKAEALISSIEVLAAEIEEYELEQSERLRGSEEAQDGDE